MFCSCISIDANERVLRLGKKHFYIWIRLFSGFELKFMSVSFYAHNTGNSYSLLYEKLMLTNAGSYRPFIDMSSFDDKLRVCNDLNFIFLIEVSLFDDRLSSSNDGKSDSQN